MEGAPKRKGRGKLKGAAMIASNHFSYRDGTIINITWIWRRVRIVMAEILWDEHKFLGWFLDRVGMIKITRNALDLGCLKKVIGILGDGGLVGIMPEGHVSPDGTLQPLKPGISWLALKGKAPVVPMFIKTAPMFHHTHVFIGKPINIAEVEQEAALTGARPVTLLTEKIAAALTELQGEYEKLPVPVRKKRTRDDPPKN
jgi:1-acyl-sn-glycerol-3-phosphate acyltransferase